MQNPDNIKYLKKYLTTQQENTDINLLEKRVNRVRTHVNPLKYLDEHKFEGFENNKSIIVDIGCAKGDFLEKFSNQFENFNYIGFEVRPLIVRYLELKFKNKDNMIFFSGNAEQNLKSVLEPSLKRGINVEYIFINFPDPWIKTKHIKRRIVSTKFLNEIFELINNYKLNTKLIIQTDVDFMSEDVKSQIEESKWKFEVFDEPLYNIQSRWEIQSIQKNKKIYRFKCTL